MYTSMYNIIASQRPSLTNRTALCTRADHGAGTAARCVAHAGFDCHQEKKKKQKKSGKQWPIVFVRGFCRKQTGHRWEIHGTLFLKKQKLTMRPQAEVCAPPGHGFVPSLMVTCEPGALTTRVATTVTVKGQVRERGSRSCGSSHTEAPEASLALQNPVSSLAGRSSSDRTLAMQRVAEKAPRGGSRTWHASRPGCQQ